MTGVHASSFFRSHFSQPPNHHPGQAYLGSLRPAAGMDLDPLAMALDLIGEEAPVVAAQAARRRPGRSGRSGRRAPARRSLAVLNRQRRLAGAQGRRNRARRKQQLLAQIQAVNRSGAALTDDHVLQLPDCKRRAAPRGKGAWKVWTTAAILKAAFGRPAAAQRQLQDSLSTLGRASHAHAGMCKEVVAECILEGQSKGLHALRLKSIEDSEAPLGENAYLGVIMNFMFDETKLPMRFDDGFHSFSTLAAHSQVPLASMSMFQGGTGRRDGRWSRGWPGR